MYLTQMHLNPARRGTRRLVASPQVMHAAVLSGLPPAGSDDVGRVLWRLDRADSRLVLYVSTPRPPDLTHLIEQAGWPTSDETWRTADTGPFLARLEVGQRFAFRLTANVVKSSAGASGTRGRIGPLRVPTQQVDWLLARAEAHGFAVPQNSTGAPQVGVSGHEERRFQRRSDGASRTVTSNQVTFDGLLAVTDPDGLRRSLADGIGRGKAYGCGLLTLAATST